MCMISKIFLDCSIPWTNLPGEHAPSATLLSFAKLAKAVKHQPEQLGAINPAYGLFELCAQPFKKDV